MYEENIFDDASFEKDEQMLSESEHILDAASDDFAAKQERSEGMAVALTWVDEGDFTFEALSSIAYGMEDEDEENEPDEDAEQAYNDLLAVTAEAFIALGGNKENVMEFIEKESDVSGQNLGDRLVLKLDANPTDDDTIVAHFAVKDKNVFDAVEKVVRDGKVVFKKKRLKKRRMSAKQKAALKKARRKANSSAAKRKRAKSNKMRKSRGM